MTIELTPLAPVATSTAGAASPRPDSYPTKNDSPQAGDIRISILSDHEWRICDRRIPESNAECVLGYVEKSSEYYEVMKLSATRTLLYYADFEQAIRSFTAAVQPAAVGNVS